MAVQQGRAAEPIGAGVISKPFRAAKGMAWQKFINQKEMKLPFSGMNSLMSNFF
ncbi:hypothetical protein [Allofranklinella schreckenbergeri]|uniref:hypothetical protein n=1 Tax=Allofranklinella schreckenbergeri TaxID=1076744 RepID=UPI001EEEBB75|nr:hypothetical protein [Allofranklinella schreckenbergeri]